MGSATFEQPGERTQGEVSCHCGRDARFSRWQDGKGYVRECAYHSLYPERTHPLDLHKDESWPSAVVLKDAMLFGDLDVG